MKIKQVRGTHDLFGEEINKFNKVVAEVKNISQQFGFNELMTPIFESSELFKKPLGEQSDVVLKEYLLRIWFQYQQNNHQNQNFQN